SPYTSTWDVVTDDVNVTALSYTWAVDGQPGGYSAGGTIPQSAGQSAPYAAPPCPPASTGVVISASFTLNGQPKKAVKAVMIFPASGSLNITDAVNSVCLISGDKGRVA